MLKDKKEVIKHSAAIQIHNHITLLQRRAWNVLLANAYDELPTVERHRVRVRELMEKLEFDSKNEEYLKEALKALTTCGVEWNTLEKDHAWEWGVTTLLAEATIKNGVCTYAYGPTLRERLHNPNMYARLSLSLQNKFKSKHAQALWELCVDYLNASKNAGETPFVPLEHYRKLMGLSDAMYPVFKDLNKYLIKAPITEINEVTDFRVDVQYQRVHRRVAAIKLRMWRTFPMPARHTQHGTLSPDLADMPTPVQELTHAGLAEHDARHIWQQGFDSVDPERRPTGVEFATYVQEKIHLLKQQDASKVKNPAGFLLAALKQNYTNPAFTQQQQTHARRITDRTLRDFQDKKTELMREEHEKIHHICAQMIRETPAIVGKFFDMPTIQQSYVFRQFYQRSRTPFENYAAHGLLAREVDREFMKQCPEKFTVIRKEYAEKLAALDQKIAALEEGREAAPLPHTPSPGAP